MDSVHHAIFKTNDPPDAQQALIIQSRLAHASNELSILEETLLKLSLLSAEAQRQRDQVLTTVNGMRGALSPIRVIPPEILAAVFLMCRNEDLTSPMYPSYSIVNARQAPLVLTRVSSRWRTVCHSTRNLWDHIHIDPIFGLPSPAFVRQILSRSGALPLHINLATSEWTSARARKVFNALLRAQDRFQDIQLDVTSSDIPSAVWRTARTFPSLASAKINLRDANERCPAVGLFTAAPCLRTVELSADNPNTLLWESAFPWWSLTELHLDHLRVLSGRSILIQCARLQKCSLSLLDDSEDSNIPHPQQITQLQDLTHLDIKFDEDAESSLPNFFEALALPKLTHLSVYSVTWQAHILPDLYQRSAFNLEELKLFDLDLNLYNVVPFLRLVQSLQCLHLECFGLNNELLAVFTSNATPLSLMLPHLRSLTFVDLGGEVEDEEDCEREIRLQDHAINVLNLAQSLSRPPGENATFPALHSVTWEGSESDGYIVDCLEELSYDSSVFSYTRKVEEHW
ncbi:hypothetical protein B0H19DRAFT_1228282 [Mycena capillaripes]|nr:hypothetical protein B0H19DRAFT_1228282 [Mycena capillaripes]